MINNEYAITAPALLQTSINGLINDFRRNRKQSLFKKRSLRKTPGGGITIAIKNLCFCPNTSKAWLHYLVIQIY